MDELIRLSKRIAELGWASRREADRWIENSWVMVNGKVINQLGSKVRPTDTITLKKEATRDKDTKSIILLNKPLGYVSGPKEGSLPSSLDLIRAENFFSKTNPGDPAPNIQRRGLAPVGRLDVNSTGLLLLTNDGRLAKKLIGPDSRVEKEYLVRINKVLPTSKLQKLRQGLVLDGVPLRPAKVLQINDEQLQIVLKQGKYRQIRRMLHLVDLEVFALKRVRIGTYKLGALPNGKWTLVSNLAEKN